MGLGFINLQHIKFIYKMTFEKNMIKYNLHFFKMTFITKYVIL